MVSAWVHEDPETAQAIALEKHPDQALDLALLGAAFLRCWAEAAGIPPHTLLSDIALGQALDMFA